MQFAMLILLLLNAAVFAADLSTPGATRIAKWKDDKSASFGLLFDDSMSTHIKNVLPELKKRNLVGTFYVNAGGGLYKAYKGAWEKDVPDSGMVLANHTFTHKGALDVANCEEEIKLCNDAIRAALGDKTPTLISFGVPGVDKGKWNVTKEELAALLKKHNLVQRPDVGGRFAAIHLKNGPEMVSRIDKALQSGGYDFVAFHGVGGEWLSIDMPAFIQLLDAVVEQREKLWVTDPISAHKYQIERDSAETKAESADEKQIKVVLSSKADAAIFDDPLTLVTRVPASWKKCEIVQGATKSVVEVKEGSVKYNARPGSTPIVLQPAK